MFIVSTYSAHFIEFANMYKTIQTDMLFFQSITFITIVTFLFLFILTKFIFVLIADDITLSFSRQLQLKI